jgi:hypothetical protein
MGEGMGVGSGRRAVQHPAAHRRPAPRAVSGLLLTVLYVLFIGGGGALGALLLAVVAPVDDDPASAIAIGILIGAISGLLAAAGMHGVFVMGGGWWGVLPGIGIGVAMFGLACSADIGDNPSWGGWLVVGAIGFVIALVGFYAIGMITHTIPGNVVESFGSPGSIAAGALRAVIGLMAHLDGVFIIGLGLAVVGATIFVVRRFVVRAPREGD